MSRSDAAARPNVVIIHCHDLGKFISPYGADTVHTPYLGAFAEDAVVFEQAYAAAPQCSPARAALFTGAYPQRNGVLGLTHPPFNWDLSQPGTHIANVLHAAGYRTALIGVHHESRELPDDIVGGRLGFDTVTTGGHADLVADRSIEAMTELAAADEPFYLQVGFYEPHRLASRSDAPGVLGFLGDHIEPDDSLGITVPPYLHDDESARAEIAEIQGAVRFMDAQVGRVLDAIDRLDLAAETVVAFTTDHGLALPRAKCSLYDAGLEVALLMRVPFRDGWSGRRVGGLVSHLDVCPTIHELTGVTPGSALDGRSLVPVVEDDAPTSEHVYGQLTYHNYYDPKRSVRSQRYKLIVNFASTPSPMDPTQSWARRTTPREIWRRGRLSATKPVELYDLAADPWEERNLALAPDAGPVLAGLGRTLLSWMRDVADPLLSGAVTSPHHRNALETLEEMARTHRPVRPGDARVPAAAAE